MTAFQGEMDATVAEAADASRVTSALAWSAAVRACGSAVAVRMLPLLAVAPAVGMLSAVATAVLLGGGLVVVAIAKAYAALRRPADPTGRLAGRAAVDSLPEPIGQLRDPAEPWTNQLCEPAGQPIVQFRGPDGPRRQPSGELGEPAGQAGQPALAGASAGQGG